MFDFKRKLLSWQQGYTTKEVIVHHAHLFSLIDIQYSASYGAIIPYIPVIIACWNVCMPVVWPVLDSCLGSPQAVPHQFPRGPSRDTALPGERGQGRHQGCLPAMVQCLPLLHTKCVATEAGESRPHACIRMSVITWSSARVGYHSDCHYVMLHKININVCMVARFHLYGVFSTISTNPCTERSRFTKLPYLLQEDGMDFLCAEDFTPTNMMDRWIISFTQSLITFVKEEMKSVWIGDILSACLFLVKHLVL